MNSLCFWTVCSGLYAGMMEKAIAQARACGVFSRFHVLSDREIQNCCTYDCMDFEKNCGLFKLYFAKGAIAKLNYDYFVWIDADSEFNRPLPDLLQVLRGSPIHVPLLPLDEGVCQLAKGITAEDLRALQEQHGARGGNFIGHSGFWVVSRRAIEHVFELGLEFWHSAKRAGYSLNVSVVLGYVMQMYCANPGEHLLGIDTALWNTAGIGPNSKAHPPSESAIFHLSCRHQTPIGASFSGPLSPG